MYYIIKSLIEVKDLFINAMHFKIFHLVFLIFLFVADIVLFDLQVKYILVALLASFSGSFVLEHIKKKQSQVASKFIDVAGRGIATALSGLFFGMVIVRYFDVQAIEYIAVTYFLSSITSLIIVRSILSITENNADSIVTEVFQRIFKVEPNKKTVTETTVKKTEIDTLPKDVKEITK